MNMLNYTFSLIALSLMYTLALSSLSLFCLSLFCLFTTLFLCAITQAPYEAVLEVEETKSEDGERPVIPLPLTDHSCS